jgi:uncharacterized protein (TIGR03067 family)
MSSRLTTARRQLAKRLARHGLTLSGGTVTTILSQSSVSACAPNSLVASTVKAATSVTAGSATAGAVSASVVTLTAGVLKTMLLTKVRNLAAVVLAFFLVSGVIVVGHTLAATVPTKDKPAQGNAEKRVAPAGDGILNGQDKRDEPTREELKKEIAALKELLGWQGAYKTDDGYWFTVTGETWTGGGEADYSGKIKIIEVRENLTVADLLVEKGPTKGKTCKAIFHLEGDTLHYCGTYGMDRPTEFKGNTRDPIYYAWKRVKE